MRYAKTLTLIAGVLLSVTATARDAAAQGFFINPFATFTLTSPSTAGSRSKAGVGLSVGKVGKIIGGEFEFSFYPEVLDNQVNGVSRSRVLTFGGSTLIGPPKIGPIKVYGALGVGDLILNVKGLASVATPSPATLTNHYVTLNYGGGAMIFVVPHFGIRADIRQYRAYGFNFGDLGTTATISLSKFKFWRLTTGVTLAF